MTEQIRYEPPQVLSLMSEIIEQAQGRLDFAVQNGLRQIQKLFLRREAEHGQHVRFLNFLAAKADKLVERGFGITHGPFGAAGDGVKGSRLDLDVFFFSDGGQIKSDKFHGNAEKNVTLEERE